MDGGASKVPVGTKNSESFRKAKRAEGTVRQEVYFPGELSEAIDAFRAATGIPSRPEAIRRLCELGIKAVALLATLKDLETFARPGDSPAAPPASTAKASTPGGRS